MTSHLEEVCMPALRFAARIVTVFILVMTVGLTATRAASAETPDKPARPSPDGAKSDKFTVKTAICRDFLALAPNVRGLVTAWTAGRYYQSKTTDTWMLDEASATKVLATVEEECRKTPDASFRYKVVGVVKKKR
jgi:hypothetical protein